MTNIEEFFAILRICRWNESCHFLEDAVEMMYILKAEQVSGFADL